MRDKINKRRVLLEVLPDQAKIVTIKRKKTIRAKVLSVGSQVETNPPLKEGDIVLVFNEGVELQSGGRKGRVLNDVAVLLKEPRPYPTDHTITVID